MQEWRINLFRPEDAVGVVALYRAVYGEDYPVKNVYDPSQLIREQATGDVFRVIAHSLADEVIGHIAFYRSSPPNRQLYEYGQMMIRFDWRNTALAFELGDFAIDVVAREQEIDDLWGEAVCHHPVTQRMCAGQGFMVMGIELGLMSGEACSHAMQNRTDPKERVSAALVFRSTAVRKQHLFLPADYETVLRELYGQWSDESILTMSTETTFPETPGRYDLQVFGDAGVARITVIEVGEDFASRLAHFETTVSMNGCVVTQVFLSLADPAIGAAVSILRRKGFFFGGALPRWFGEDGLLMQKVMEAPDFSKIVLATKQARRLGDYIREDYEQVRIATVGALLERRAVECGERTAVIWASRNLRQTYAELYESALKVAKALAACGIAPGAHAAIWAPNVPEYLAVEFGCALAGVPVLFINTGYRAYELEYALRQSDTRILFLAAGNLQAGEYEDIVREVRERLPDLRHVVVFMGKTGEGFTAWPEFLARVDGSDNATIVGGGDIFSIQYTSGTTGQPKAALVSHQAYVSNSFAIAERQGLTGNDVVCVPLPLFHAYGCLTLFSAFAAGATAVVGERFRAADLLAAVERYGGTSISGTPTMFVAALTELDERVYDLSSMRGGNVAGAFCPPELPRQVIERMHAPEFGILYGSTEALVSLMNSPDGTLADRTGTVGATMPGFDVRIIDPHTGETLPPGQQGELLLHGPGLMQGYYRMPEATAKTIDEQGWLHSGDLAVADDAGRVRITGRLKELIIRGGENVFPAEIEQFLLTHPKVRDAQVVGIPCDYYGEDIVAFIRLKAGETASALELKKYCRSRIAIDRVPALFFFVDEYPLTASGKVQKFKLQEIAKQKMSEL